MHFFNHVLYRIYGSRTKNVEITATASLTLLYKVLNSEINIPLCWSSMRNVSAKLYCHQQVVYISLQRKCALGGGLSYCRQRICCCTTELLFLFFLTINKHLSKKCNLKQYEQKHKLTKEQQRQDNTTHNNDPPPCTLQNSNNSRNLYPPHANTPQRRSTFVLNTGCLKTCNTPKQEDSAAYTDFCFIYFKYNCILLLLLHLTDGCDLHIRRSVLLRKEQTKWNDWSLSVLMARPNGS
jgi:hypothetical protein